MILGLCLQARTKKYYPGPKLEASAEEEARLIVDWIQKAIDYKAAALLEEVIREINTLEGP